MMRRLLVILSLSVTVLSLLLFVSTVVLWTRSYSTPVGVWRLNPSAYDGIAIMRGQVAMLIVRIDSMPINAPDTRDLSLRDFGTEPLMTLLADPSSIDPDAHPEVAGFLFSRTTGFRRSTVVKLPAVFVAALFAGTAKWMEDGPIIATAMATLAIETAAADLEKK